MFSSIGLFWVKNDLKMRAREGEREKNIYGISLVTAIFNVVKYYLLLHYHTVKAKS